MPDCTSIARMTSRWCTTIGSVPGFESSKMRVATGPGRIAETWIGAFFTCISRLRHSLNASTACLLMM